MDFGDSICVNAGRVLDGVTSTKKEISLCCARMWQRERFRFRDFFGIRKEYRRGKQNLLPLVRPRDELLGV
nr:MAG TPA: hypothetical protein [Caudoviricetes sp.]